MASRKDSLGDRMKGYENVSRNYVGITNALLRVAASLRYVRRVRL